MNSEYNRILQRLQKICDYLEIESILCSECAKVLRENTHKINQEHIILHRTCINRLLVAFDGYLGLILKEGIE